MKTRKTRSKNWRRPVWAAFWAMLFFLLLGGQFFCIRTGSGELFSGEEWVFPAGTFSQSQLDELDQEGRYGYLCRTPGTVALPKTGEERNVQVGLGNQAYGEICGISFQYGRWFEEGAEEVVLSSRLSEALFGEKNPCGLTLAVDGRELMICGVYSQRQGFLSQLSGDGSELIFTSRKDYGGGEDGQYAVYLPQAETGGFYQKAQDQLALLTGNPAQPELAFHYGETLRLLEQNGKLMLLLGELAAILFLIRQLRWMAGPIRRCLREEASISIPQAVHMLFVLLLGAVCVLFWFFFRFQLFVPAWLLPPDNLFDLGYYRAAVLELVTAVHRTGFDSYYWNLSVCLLAESFLLLGLSVIPILGFLAAGRGKGDFSEES